MAVHVDFEICIDTLAQLGTRAREALIHRNIHRHKPGDLFFQSYTILYNACVLPVIRIAVQFGDQKMFKINTVQNKTMRNFLCVNTSNCCIIGDNGMDTYFYYY